MAQKKPTKRKSQSIVKKRIANQKQEVLEALERTPIPSYAFKRVGISKATYHRWRAEDPAFNQEARQAIYRGSESMCDLAEAKLLEHIREGNLRAITFYLKHHKREYIERRRIEVEDITPKPIDKKSKHAVDEVFAMFERVARRAEEKYVLGDDAPDDGVVIIDD